MSYILPHLTTRAFAWGQLSCYNLVSEGSPSELALICRVLHQEERDDYVTIPFDLYRVPFADTSPSNNQSSTTLN